jgi:hypothetical protein
MTANDFTLLDEGRSVPVRAVVDDSRVILKAPALERALSWELKPEGFCKGAKCVAIPDQSAVVSDEGIDLVEFARLIDRPIAVEPEERVAYVGTSAGDRAAALVTLEAPDFTLPDVDGTPYSLSDYRGKKVLLVAYASW